MPHPLVLLLVILLVALAAWFLLAGPGRRAWWAAPLALGGARGGAGAAPPAPGAPPEPGAPPVPSPWPETPSHKCSRELREALGAQIARLDETMDLDWSRVWATLEPLLDDNHEWYGTIDLTDRGSPAGTAQPVVTRLRRGRSASSVESDEIALINGPLALMVFHTHPGHSLYNVPPSPNDILFSILDATYHHRFGHLVVSRSGITLYGPAPSLRARLGDAKVPMSQVSRYSLDITRSLAGLSHQIPDQCTFDQLVEVHNNFGLRLLVFPRDRHARVAAGRITFAIAPDEKKEMARVLQLLRQWLANDLKAEEAAKAAATEAAGAAAARQAAGAAADAAGASAHHEVTDAAE